MKKGTATLLIVLSIVLIVMSLVVLIISPVTGCIFLAFGVVILIYGIRGKKKLKEVASSSASDQKDNSLFLAVAGVTFKNDDGSSRQSILKKIAESDDYSDATAYLERYDFEGNDAISVSTVFGMVGNIRHSDVQKVLPILEGGYVARIYPETFEDENDKLIYRADVKITPLS